MPLERLKTKTIERIKGAETPRLPIEDIRAQIATVRKERATGSPETSDKSVLARREIGTVSTVLREVVTTDPETRDLAEPVLSFESPRKPGRLKRTETMGVILPSEGTVVIAFGGKDYWVQKDGQQPYLYDTKQDEKRDPTESELKKFPKKLAKALKDADTVTVFGRDE